MRKLTPKTVSGRVVNTSMRSFAGQGLFQRKGDGGPVGLADPVALHGQHAFRPAALQLGKILQELVAVGGDAQEPLGQILLFHTAVAAPAQAVDDLLVGQHGMAGRAPVLRGLLAVDEALFQEAQEEFLFPA